MLYELIVPQSVKMLHNLSHILTKAEKYAETKKIDADYFPTARLAPDMLNFTRQIHIACDTAKLGCSRLTGKDAPKHDDTEKTLPELKARIESTIGYLSKFTAADFKDAETRQITQPRWEGKYLTGTEYANHHVLPNLYFHITAAYAILRHNGVDIGKKDYLGEMPYKK